MSALFEPGRTCWRVERAGRVAVLVDAASYFEVLAEALERAERSVWILGWDIHSRCRLGPRDAEGDGEELADLLDRRTAERPDLDVRILSWDPAPIYAFERELLPVVAFGWRTGPRVTLRLADDHPTGGSHHQKVVVIDDRIAFVGGIDLTIARWDERAHAPADRRRRLPLGTAYPPFHDVQMAVDGDAARALGELARERWRRATDEAIEAPAGGSDTDRWPASLTPGVRDVDVALARTEPRMDGREPVREVEALFLECIAAAEHSLYIENQYLSSSRIGEALRARLAEPHGPEIVVVTPRAQAGRLEQSTMGVLRARLLRRLREADAHGRLRVVGPVVPGDVGVNVHAKVMVVDDRVLRVGSANLSDRSQGLDTECDAAVEAHDEATRTWIRDVRDGLLAEHLGVSRETVRASLAREGSLLAALDALRGGERTLVDLEPELDEALDALVPHASLIDPDRGFDEALVARALPRELAEEGQRRLPRLALATAAALALLVPVAAGTLGLGPHPTELLAYVARAAAHPTAPWIAVPVFVLASLARVPVTVLVTGCALAFGPWVGSAVAL
ncbi:MAG TPA: phospholipase D-like domain-containing protein, partial [Sandaracinaceae bacterium LLY-WYZ-13_1]|nr:phospholipase D-like domain-containing protein [Sandaracinaceae bacterium LLY-WYZ-13_1]